MSNPNYTLEIVSHHPTFKNKSLRKYYVDGIDTVGAWGDEPFEIVFKNHTWQKVQVKISVDGTDVLTGEPATTDVSNDMWVVNGYGTLNLKAWPETNNGGASFVFTSANNSVAIHTHGDLSNRGIIAAAVFTEGHVEPVRLNPPLHIDHHHHHWPTPQPYYPVSPIWIGGTFGNTGSLGGGTFGSSGVSYNAAPASAGGSRGMSSNSIQNCSLNSNVDSSAYFTADMGEAKSLESLAAVGAGQHVDQKITHVAGLIKPIFGETVRVKYMWWDDLVSKLRAYNVPMPQPSGFPGDKKQANINLGKTPRIGQFGKAFPRERPQPQPIQSYLRVYSQNRLRLYGRCEAGRTPPFFFLGMDMKNKKLEAIENILVKDDPVKLIKMGAPLDEYSSEALLIYERINRYTSVESIHQIMYDVFVSQFGNTKERATKIIGPFEDYKKIAEQIKQVIGE